MKLLMGRSRLKLDQSLVCSSEYEICLQEGIRKQQKDFKRTRIRISTKKARVNKGTCQSENLIMKIIKYFPLTNLIFYVFFLIFLKIPINPGIFVN